MADHATSPHVVVVGGGLAGLTAALDLADGGAQVTLVERRPYPGGKTFSFADPTTGVELDNGQHILLRCCTAYLALLDRLGLRDRFWIQDRLRVPVHDPVSGRTSVIFATPYLPAPLHLTPSVLRFGHLSRREKLALARAFWPLARLSESDRRRLDDQSFADWLRGHGQSDAVIDRFWDLIVLPTCNDRAEHVSASQAIMVFQVGLLRDAHAAEIGAARVGLSAVAEAALDRLRAAGGAIRLGSAAQTLTAQGQHASGVEFGDGTTIAADAVVLALPPNHARLVLPESWRGRAGFAALVQFQYAPIVNIYLQWDRPVMSEPFLAVLDPAVQYVFNRSRIFGLARAGAMDRLFPERARTRRYRNHRPRSSTRPRRESGTPSPSPARQRCYTRAWSKNRKRRSVPCRDRRRTDWDPLPRRRRSSSRARGRTLTGPATMESAVRSGHAAARACLASLHDASVNNTAN